MSLLDDPATAQRRTCKCGQQTDWDSGAQLIGVTVSCLLLSAFCRDEITSNTGTAFENSATSGHSGRQSRSI